MKRNSMIVYLAIMLVFCSALVLSCEREIEPENPVLRMEVIKMFSPGIIISLHGDVNIKKKASLHYVKAVEKTIVGDGDIIEVKKNGNLRLRSGDATITLGAEKKDNWFIFEQKKP